MRDAMPRIPVYAMLLIECLDALRHRGTEGLDASGLPPRRPTRARARPCTAAPMKRTRAAAAETADGAASDAFTALRIARELNEDGDAESARSCVEHAVDRARHSASLAGAPLTFDEASAPLSGGGQAPAAFLASAGLATLGVLHRAADDLDAARVAFEQSLHIWPGSAAHCATPCSTPCTTPCTTQWHHTAPRPLARQRAGAPRAR